MRNQTSGSFIEFIRNGYHCKGDSLLLGAGKWNNNIYKDAAVSVPLKTLNRHGLIAGATGTGKTKTLQVIIEELSRNGIPTLVMDVKGDLSGIAAGGVTNAKIRERSEFTGIQWLPEAMPVEFLTLSGEKGTRLRATVLEFGPVLFSKILELNDTQAGVVSLVFKYCDDNRLPLLDLKDFRKVLQYVTNEGKTEIEKDYGRVSTASTATIIRKVLELEQQGADLFFGERSFDPDDLLRVDEQGRGYVNILRLTDIQDKPKLFSTFMLSLLAEVYQTFPEEGDLEQPKLVLFIDEAHLIFDEASKALQDQIETIVKLIRSKGVGVFFCTQQPTDIPDAVLGQLGLKVQHALRAFTAKDRKTIKSVAENYPLSEYYQTSELLTSLGIGEALVTCLDEKGVPAPLVHTYLRAPASRMDVLSDNEIENIVNASSLAKSYNEVIDRDSAYEMLGRKMAGEPAEVTQKKKTTPGEKSLVEQVSGSVLGRQLANTVVRELTRGMMGILGLRGTGRRRRSLF